MTARLDGKRCLIVGGTSGLGLAATRRFLAEGARVICAGLDPVQVEASAAEFAAQGLVGAFTCDATTAGAVEHLFAQAVAALGGLDVLYHAAGASGRRQGDGALTECSLEGWRWTLEANLTSVFLTNRAAVQQFLRQGAGGAILNMSSVLALAPSPHHFDTCAYAAAKGGVIALSRYAAAKYAPAGVRVNVLAPGLIDTPMAQRAVQDPAIAHFLQSKQPLAAGAGKPQDCAGTAVFLCSDEAQLLTGQVVAVDGGWCVSEGQYGQG